MIAMTRNNIDERDLVHIIVIVRYVSDARKFIEGMSLADFEHDRKTQMATAMAIAQVGEHVKRLSRSFRESEPGTAWKAIAGTRDWLVHDYDNVDLEELFDSVRNDSQAVLNVLLPYIDLGKLDHPAPRTHLDDAPWLGN